MSILRKLPATIARLAELPSGSQVVHASAPNRPRRIEGIFFDRGQNNWLASLDGRTTCPAHELRISGDQLDLLTPCDGMRSLA